MWRGVHEGWEAALKRDDELREDVQAGKCLYTFREAEHYFPPTLVGTLAATVEVRVEESR